MNLAILTVAYVAVVVFITAVLVGCCISSVASMVHQIVVTVITFTYP